MEITLTRESVKALQDQFRQRGTTAEQLALKIVRSQFVTATQTEQSEGERSASAEVHGSLADFRSGSSGVLHSND